MATAGARAPSGDNTQPWRFRWNGSALYVLFVPERAESLYEVRWAASWISLGAVLVNMELAAGTRGYRLDVDLFPADGPPGVVATVRLETAPVAADLLTEAIPARCVNRRAYRREAIAAGARDRITALAAAVPGVALSWHEREPARGRIAALAAQNDRILFENRALHTGLYRWLRWTRDEVERSQDGMPIETLEMTAAERFGFRLLGTWPWARLAGATGITRGLPMRARQIYRRSGAIALLAVDGERPEDFVRGGQVMERIWLTATREGMALQPITGITFLLLRLRLAGGEGLGPSHQRLLARLDREFVEIFGDVGRQTPVMLFRIGLASAPSARAPRLPLDQVLVVDTASHRSPA